MEPVADLPDLFGSHLDTGDTPKHDNRSVGRVQP